MIQVLSLFYSPTVTGGSVDYFFNLFPLLFRLGIFFCFIRQFTDSSVFSILVMSSLTEPLYQVYFSVLKLPFVLLYISYLLRFSIYSCFMYVICFSLKWQVHCSFLKICLLNSQVWITRLSVVLKQFWCSMKKAANTAAFYQPLLLHHQCKYKHSE